MNGHKHVKRIYLDYNATTPVDEEVAKTISSSLIEDWGNPSSTHEEGVHARHTIDEARKAVADMISCHSSEIIFTSGGTESNNLVIQSSLTHFHKVRKLFPKLQDAEIPHIITSNIEHDSVILPLKRLEQEGKISLTTVAVSRLNGCVEPEDVISQIRNNTCFITVMLANNETGIIQPIEEIGSLLVDANRKRKEQSLPEILFHTDAAQALGKIEVNVVSLHVDYLTIVGHKFYGPRIGALFFKRSKPLHPIMFGGGQERGFRPGTENTCMIAGLGKAAELVQRNLKQYQRDMEGTRNFLEVRLKECFGNDVLFNHRRNDVGCLPNTCSVAFRGLNGKDLLKHCMEIQASTGAACHSQNKPSAILLQSGVSTNDAQGTLRLTTGRETTFEDIEVAVQSMQKGVKLLKCKSC